MLPAETISEASKATLDSLAQWSEPSLCETQSPELVFSARIHQLHAAFGRLRHHMNELESYQRYHKRLLQRLDKTQGKPEDHKDELLPASVLQLLTLAKPKLDAHLQRLSLRIQMVEHEKLFYKWVNGLLVPPAAALSPELLERPQRSSDSDTQLAIVRKEAASARAVFEASQAVHQQLRCNYEQQMLEWKQRKKSRAQSEQMDMRMQRVAHDIRTKEIFDPQRLFLQSARTWEQPRSQVNKTEEESIPMNEDLVRLRSQLEQVLQEITRDYCRLELI